MLNRGLGIETPFAVYDVPDSAWIVNEGTVAPWLFVTAIALKLAECE